MLPLQSPSWVLQPSFCGSSYESNVCWRRLALSASSLYDSVQGNEVARGGLGHAIYSYFNRTRGPNRKTIRIDCRGLEKY